MVDVRPCCAIGKRVTGAHRRLKRSDDDIAEGTPVISFGYMGPESKEDTSENIEAFHVLVGIARKSKWLFAHMVPKKGTGSACHLSSGQGNQTSRIPLHDTHV